MKKNILILGGSSFIGIEYISRYNKQENIYTTYFTNNISFRNIKKYKLDLSKSSKTNFFFNKLSKIHFDKILILVSNNQNRYNSKTVNSEILVQNSLVLINILESIVKFKVSYNKIIAFDSFDRQLTSKTIYKICKNFNLKLFDYYKKNFNLKIRIIKLYTVLGLNVKKDHDQRLFQYLYFTLENKIKPKFINKNNKFRFHFLNDVIKNINNKKNLINKYSTTPNKLYSMMSNIYFNKGIPNSQLCKKIKKELKT